MKFGPLAYLDPNTQTRASGRRTVDMLIDNKKTKLKLGVIYVPQENTTLNEELKKMYQEIEDQIEQARQQCENIIIVGDFNAKIEARRKEIKKQ